MKKRTKITIIIFVIFFIFCYVKLGMLIDRKWESYWYKSDLKSFSHYDEEGVKHFPRELPKSAKSIKHFGGSGRDGCGFYVTMKMDKQWISDQIKRYDYMKIESSDNYPAYYYTLFSEEKVNSNFTYYFIYHNQNSNFPYCYGLGVNKDGTKIIYHYEDYRKNNQ